MKKFLMIIVALAFMIVLVGCGQAREADVEAGVKAKLEMEEQEVEEQEVEEQEAKEQEEIISVSWARDLLVFSSLEEFLVSYLEAGASSARGSALSAMEESVGLLSLERFYLPTNIPEEYILYRIEMCENMVMLWFLPEEHLGSELDIINATVFQQHFLFSFTRNFIQTHGLENPMAGVMEQHRVVESDLIEGKYFFREPNSFRWAMDDELLHLQTPIPPAVGFAEDIGADMVRYAEVYVLDLTDKDAILSLLNQGPPQAPNQLTLHFYGRPDTPVVIPVEIGQPLCPVTVADVTRRVYGEGPHDRNDGWAFWGWFTDTQLDSSGRVRDGHRRPTVGTMGFDIGAVMTEAQLNPLAVGGNVDLHAIWIRWGDVNDDGRVDVYDIEHLTGFLRNFMPRPVINMITADVNRDEIVNIYDLEALTRYTRNLNPRPILGQQPVAPAFVPLSVGEVRFEASHESGAPGDYVRVRVSVEDNTSLGFYMTLFDVEFDTANMEFVDYRGGNYSAKGMEAPWVTYLEDDGAVRIMWMAEIVDETMTPYTDTGLYLELQFRIRDTASSGATEVNLIAPPVGGVAGFGGIIQIPFSFVSGSVTVIN